MAHVTVRIPIPDDCCSVARAMISHGLDPDNMLEFVRGDVVCLRGTARAFASQMVVETRNGPRHVPFEPLDAKAMARLSTRVRPPMR